MGILLANSSNDWNPARSRIQTLEKKMISSHTKAFAVLGHPIAHTLSPAMHNAAFHALGMDAVYLAFDVLPERLAEVLGAMRDMGFGGANLTVPLKEVACRGVAKLDESAQLLGAVNTIQFAADGVTGHNTDGAGFLAAVEEAFGEPVAGKSVFVLGTGGAGRAVALSCAGSGVRSLTLADTDPARPRKVAMEVETQFFTEVKIAESWEAEAREADLVVQATPLGMKIEDDPPIGPGAFRPGQFALDLVYMHPETKFTKAAKDAGAHAANGLGMLLHQGAKAFEIWTGLKPPVDIMKKALEKAVYGG
jgi:shikimate dehydrogenase